MDAKEFKNKAIDLLEYCLEETERCTEEDGLDGEDLQYSIIYCEGLYEAINIIKALDDGLNTIKQMEEE